jgi:hypothetical protein
LGFSEAAQATPIHFVSAARVDGRRLTLRDVADLSDLPAPLRGAAGGTVIAVAPPGRTRLLLSASRVRRRLGAAIPALSPWLRTPASEDVEATIRIDFAPAAVAETARCAIVQRFVPQGEAITTADVRTSACTGAARSALRYDDRTGGVRALGDLYAADEIREPAASSLAILGAGRTITLTARFGPVTVSRQVRSLQPIFNGRGAFVRSADGQTFAVTAGEIAPESTQAGDAP